MPSTPSPTGIQKPKDAHTIGNYQVLDTLGSGGMGIVYKVRNWTQPSAPELALKRLKKQEGENDRFTSEAKALQKLVHPHIVQFKEFTLDSQGPYLVTEFLEGIELETLRKLAAAHGGISTPLALSITAQVASALSAIHAASMAHRDLKLANIMTTRNVTTEFLKSKPAQGITVKVLDLGIALDAERPHGQTTSAGSGLGTLLYFAPEQLQQFVSGVASTLTRAERLHAAQQADLFALGLIAFALLEGKLLYDAPSTKAGILKEIQALQAAQQSALAALAEKLPTKLEQSGAGSLLLGLLSSDPQDRPGAAEVLEQLATLGVHPDSPAEHAPVEETRRTHQPLGAPPTDPPPEAAAWGESAENILRAHQAAPLPGFSSSAWGESEKIIVRSDEEKEGEPDPIAPPPLEAETATPSVPGRIEIVPPTVQRPAKLGWWLVPGVILAGTLGVLSLWPEPSPTPVATMGGPGSTPAQGSSSAGVGETPVAATQLSALVGTPAPTPPEKTQSTPTSERQPAPATPLPTKPRVTPQPTPAPSVELETPPVRRIAPVEPPKPVRTPEPEPPVEVSRLSLPVAENARGAVTPSNDGKALAIKLHGGTPVRAPFSGTVKQQTEKVFFGKPLACLQLEDSHERLNLLVCGLERSTLPTAGKIFNKGETVAETEDGQQLHLQLFERSDGRFVPLDLPSSWR